MFSVLYFSSAKRAKPQLVLILNCVSVCPCYIGQVKACPSLSRSGWLSRWHC